MGSDCAEWTLLGIMLLGVGLIGLVTSTGGDTFLVCLIGSVSSLCPSQKELRSAACGCWSRGKSRALSELDRLALRFCFVEVLTIAAVTDLRSCRVAVGWVSMSLLSTREAKRCRVDCFASPLLRCSVSLARQVSAHYACRQTEVL